MVHNLYNSTVLSDCMVSRLSGTIKKDSKKVVSITYMSCKVCLKCLCFERCLKIMYWYI